MHIKSGDTVEVITGDDKGSRGKVLRILRKENRIVVEGVNKVLKHVRPSQKNPKGGRLSKELPIQFSNVLLVCTACGKATRTGARRLADGSKVRCCKKCEANIGQVQPSKSRDAKRSES